jgi:hypothetical protein
VEGLLEGTGAPPDRIQWRGPSAPLEGRSPRLTWVSEEEYVQEGTEECGGGGRVERRGRKETG